MSAKANRKKNKADFLSVDTALRRTTAADCFPQSPCATPKPSNGFFLSPLGFFGGVPLGFPLTVGVNLLCLSTICFSYSFSAFKVDLKKLMAWNENELSWVFMFATAGQNTVVHLGLFCDRFGAPWGYLVAAVLKGTGLLGMWWCAATNRGNIWLFGFFFFLDTQGMSAGVIMALKEVQRTAPSRLSGLMASLCKGFFGLGAFFATSAYDYYCRPDVAWHFLNFGIMGTISLLLAALFVPLLGPKSNGVKAKSSQDLEDKPLMTIACSEAYVALFLGMFVAWGGAMVWNANMASFAIAAGRTDGPRIRSAYYSAKMICSLLAGPLSDFGAREVWWTLTVGAMFMSCVIMLCSGGEWMLLAATMAGGSFGAVATLIPLMTKLLSFQYMGTLYAASKFAGMISSVVWTFYTGYVAQQATKPGDTNCVGTECYTRAWYLILGSSTPIMLFLIAWAFKSARPGMRAKKKEE